MTWTGRSDAVRCCESGRGAVLSGEQLARLLHTRNLPPNFDPFPRKELFPGKDGQFSNVCGDADGASVVRSSTLTDAEICERSGVQAAVRPNRDPHGAFIGPVDQLRLSRPDGLPDAQHVFVYDDPKPDDDLHAVIRGRETLDRPEQSRIISLIVSIIAEKLDCNDVRSSILSANS